MPAPPRHPFDPELVRFLTGGRSLNLAAADGEGRPSQCRALGCRIDGAGARVTVFLSRHQGADLLRDAARNGALAAVFSDPPTHRTLQLKGSDARPEPLAPGDADRVAAYRTAFVQGLLPLGFKEPLIRALLDCPDQDLVALAFTPEAVFNQTPGAQAGTPLTPPVSPGAP